MIRNRYNRISHSQTCLWCKFINMSWQKVTLVYSSVNWTSKRDNSSHVRDNSGHVPTTVNKTDINEPTHEIMALIALCKLNIQTRMRSNPLGLHFWFLVRLFVYCYILCVRTAKALARLRGCAVSPESPLFAYAISTIISWAGSNRHQMGKEYKQIILIDEQNVKD